MVISLFRFELIYQGSHTTCNTPYYGICTPPSQASTWSAGIGVKIRSPVTRMTGGPRYGEFRHFLIEKSMDVSKSLYGQLKRKKLSFQCPRSMVFVQLQTSSYRTLGGDNGKGWEYPPGWAHNRWAGGEVLPGCDSPHGRAMVVLRAALFDMRMII